MFIVEQQSSGTTTTSTGDDGETGRQKREWQPGSLAAGDWDWSCCEGKRRGADMQRQPDGERSAAARKKSVLAPRRWGQKGGRARFKVEFDGSNFRREQPHAPSRLMDVPDQDETPTHAVRAVQERLG